MMAARLSGHHRRSVDYLLVACFAVGVFETTAVEMANAGHLVLSLTYHTSALFGYVYSEPTRLSFERI